MSFKNQLLMLCFCAFFPLTTIASSDSDYILNITGTYQLDTDKENDNFIKVQAGGKLICYSGTNGSGKVINWHMNSAHNCCNQGGKSWTCPNVNNGNAVNCSANKSTECH